MGRAGAIHWMKPNLSAVSTASANIKAVWALLKESCFAWTQDSTPSLGAALTFYAILSLAPVLIVATAIAGLGLGQKVAEGLLGETSARALQTAIISDLLFGAEITHVYANKHGSLLKRRPA
jgi:hypothetical protein